MQPGRIFPVLCICWVLFHACRNSHPPGQRQSVPSAILHCEDEFNIEGLTYLVAENGHIIREKPGGAAEEMSSALAILSHFTTPLILDRMIRDSVAHEQDSVTQWLKAKDLIFVPANYYERDRGMKDPMTERMLKLVEKYKRPGVNYDTGWFAGKLQFHT